jgi:hypothetical protein
MNEFVVQSLSPYIDTIPFWMRGLTASGVTVWGLYVKTLDGIGFIISYKKEKVLIINNFAFRTTCPPRPFAGLYEDLEESDEPAEVSPQTVKFWLSSGMNTKSVLTKEEMDQGTLISQLSEEGLSKNSIPHPILYSRFFTQVHITDDDVQPCSNTICFLETGRLLPYIHGDMAPKPLHSYIQAIKKEDKNAWHIARAQLSRKGDATNTKVISKCGKFITYYDFEDDRHILRIQEFSHSSFKTWSAKLDTHPPSCAGSPPPAFVLDDPPDIPDISDIAGVYEETYNEKLSQMTNDELISEKCLVHAEFVLVRQKLADIMEEEKKRV